ncbi:neuroglian-like isoform X2 [Ostrea edulis]|uniref:neuroglian-like isoform X2 n=1 Tax=Ostrea edulis TaxID=37623 RepID=UPI0024AFB6E9|nr:neuroglian-like isoform X2 [Ostrea edulis]XP_056000703.1 neuroglian-like isoform X2 [Ostrea edulis]
MNIFKKNLAILFTFLCGTCLGQKVIPNRPPGIYMEPDFNVFYKYGESVKLPCRADGVPRPTYRWKRNGIDLNPSGNDNRFVQLSDEGTIVINAPEDKDEGIFQCIADNNFGISVSINVNFREGKLDEFEVAQSITHRPHLGESVTLNCVPPTSFPPADVEWVLKTQEGNIEPINYNNRISMDLEGRLYITNVQEQDYKDGKAYVCMAINYFMRRNTYDKANYIIPSGSSPVKRPAEYLWASPSDHFGLRGENFKLKCIFSGNPTPEVFWLKNKETIPDHYEVSLGGQELTIPELTVDDAGPYECYGTNTQGPRAFRNFVIRVESKPYWDVQPHDVETSVGAAVTFLCKAKGYPDPKIAWLINGVKLEESKVSIIQSDRFLKPDANNITFVNLNKNDHMVIQCNASNIHGYVFSDVYLNILEEEPAIIVPPALELKVAEGRDIELTCITSGKPDPIITWRKEGEQITGGRYQIQPNGNLHIESVVLSDAGNYTCHAYNKYNFDEAWGILIVRAKTRLVQTPGGLEATAGSDAKFTCSGTTDFAEIKNLRISWLKDNKPITTNDQRMTQNFQDSSLTISGTIARDSGTYTCVVSNGLDNATAGAILTVKDKPDPPISVTLLRCGEKEAEITWTKGASNNAPIQYFMIQYNTSFSPDEWFIGASNVLATKNSGVVPLSPWVEYNFRVLATNKIGVSEPSYHTETVCKTNADRPFKNPEEVRTIGDKRNYLIIEWTLMPPIEHNGQQFKYILTIQREGQGLDQVIPVTISDWKTFRYEKQTNDIFVPYLITVKANNEIGDSSSSVVEKTGYSAEEIPTITVSDLTVDSVVTSSSVTFYWEWDNSLNTPQAGTPVNGILRGFKIQYWVRGQKEQTFQEAEVLVSDMILRYERRKKRAIQSYKYTLDGLLGYNDYEAQMRVMNTYYAGPPSAIISFRTELGVTGPVRNLRVSQSGSNFIRLTWEAPEVVDQVFGVNWYQLLSGYDIGYQTVSGLDLGNLQEKIPDITDPRTNDTFVNGLVYNTKYRLYLWPKNSKGRGEVSFIEASTSGPGSSTAPSFSIKDANQTFINVTWSLKMDPKSGTVIYIEYRKEGVYEFQRTPDEVAKQWRAITELDDGTTYEVRLVLTDGMSSSTSSIQTVRTLGVAAAYSLGANFAWFIGLILSLLIIIAVVVFIIMCRKVTKNKPPPQSKLNAPARSVSALSGQDGEYNYSYEGSMHKKSANSLDKPYYDDDGYDRYRDGYDQDDQPYDERYDDKYDDRDDYKGAYNNRHYDDRGQDYNDRYDDERYDDDRYSDDRGRYEDDDDGGFRDQDHRPSDRDDHYYPDDDKNYEPYQKRGYERTPSYEKRPIDDLDYDQYKEPGKFDRDGNPISTRPRPAPSGANGSGHVPGTSSFV